MIQSNDAQEPTFTAHPPNDLKSNQEYCYF